MVPSIAIVGGGPCGLTLARLLERQGVDYVVYERDESEPSRRVGGSLDLKPSSGQRVVKEAGLFEEFKKHARWDDTMFVLADQHGEKHFEMGEERDAPEIDRVALRKILLDSIPKEKVQWGHELKSATFNEAGRPVLHFTNGSTLSGFKLVVGADGAWSKVRSLVTPAVPQYSGRYYLESWIDRESPFYETLISRVPRGTYTALGSTKQILVMRQGDGSYRVYSGFAAAETFLGDRGLDLSNTEEVRRMLLEEFFSDWADSLKDFIRYSSDFRSWRLSYLPPSALSWKPVPGVALVGDAAHLGTPLAGEGVNCALVDAGALASAIAEHGIEHLDRAVADYEKEMFPRGIDLIKKSVGNARWWFHEDGASGLLDAYKEGKMDSWIEE